jgi:hypothetical protein
MPREYRGRTRLGNDLNKIGSKIDNTYNSASKIRYGILLKSTNGTYNYMIKVLKDDGTQDFIAGPIPLIEPPADLQARYGSPEELENTYMVKISFVGQSTNRGTASVIKHILDHAAGKEAEEVIQSAELQITGSAFAPPGGSSLI